MMAMLTYPTLPLGAILILHWAPSSWFTSNDESLELSPVARPKIQVLTASPPLEQDSPQISNQTTFIPLLPPSSCPGYGSVFSF